ncbi:MAG: hypothetical protein IJU10_05480 [Clostridia bacterium]|nr:hypothetical protein [Clostridia bacterium]
MLKALFKKQFAELFAMFFKDRRTGRQRSKMGGIILILVLAVSFVGMGAIFYTMANGILLGISEEMSFLYYFVMGLIAIAIGLLGSIFNAYNTIYNAKDNELLLSMPIPPRHIVFVRITSVAALSMLYEGVVLVPAFLARVISKPASALVVINHLLLFLFVTLFVVALTLVLAFVVAAIARKVKRKSLVTVVTSLVFIVIYYYCYFKAQGVLATLMTMTEVPSAIKKGLFLFYYMGLAAEGDAAGMAIFAAVSAAAFFLAYVVISLLFRRFAVARSSTAVKGKVGEVRSAKPQAALFKREWKRYLSLPIYILNCSFGTLMMLLAGVLVFVKADLFTVVLDGVNQAFPNIKGGVFAAAFVYLVAATNDLTAPSVSLEGRSLWLIRSMPVSTVDIFKAKVALHLALTVLPALFMGAAFVYAFRLDALSAVLLLLSVPAFVLFSATFGLMMNILKPFLDWKNETIAVKSGLSVLVSIFGMFLFVLALALLFLPLSAWIADTWYLLIMLVLFVVGDVLFIKWLQTVGVRKFEALS